MKYHEITCPELMIVVHIGMLSMCPAMFDTMYFHNTYVILCHTKSYIIALLDIMMT